MTELMQVPTPAELRDRAYGLWATSANRSSKRVRQILELEYQDFPEIALPTPSTIRTWAQRGEWRERANSELAAEYPHEVRMYRVGMWRLMQVIQEAIFDDFMGIRPMSKEQVAAAKLVFSAMGWGALGANQGGEVHVTMEQTAEDLSQLSVDERLRRLRAGYVERNVGHG